MLLPMHFFVAYLIAIHFVAVVIPLVFTLLWALIVYCINIHHKSKAITSAKIMAITSAMNNIQKIDNNISQYKK